jgi:hypothetical protein
LQRRTSTKSYSKCRYTQSRSCRWPWFAHSWYGPCRYSHARPYHRIGVLC